MNEIVKCIGIISNTTKMLKFLRILFFTVVGVFFIRIGKTVIDGVKNSSKE